MLTAEQIQEIIETVKAAQGAEDEGCCMDAAWLTAVPALLDHIVQLEAEVAGMRNAIQLSLRDENTQRHHLDKCEGCQNFIVDNKQRKFKFGCKSLCKDALQVIVKCGFKQYEPFLPYAADWRPLPKPPEAKGE